MCTRNLLSALTFVKVLFHIASLLAVAVKPTLVPYVNWVVATTLPAVPQDTDDPSVTSALPELPD